MKFLWRWRGKNRSAFQELRPQAARIADLMSLPSLQARQSLMGCLDDLLGAVYALMYADHRGYSDRPQALDAQDIQNVLIRARDMSNGRVRTDGKWTAGFYFNNALFRLAAVYHRALKIVTGNENTVLHVPQLLPQAQAKFQAARNLAWTNTKIHDIHLEVNNLKHTPEGIYAGRDVTFADSLGAVGELLTLIEVLY